ncbi:primosomal protein N' [Kaarinaea lacus]
MSGSLDEPFLYIKVAIPSSPLRSSLDYLPPTPMNKTALGNLLPGCRVLVPFRQQSVCGIVVGITSSTSVPRHKLKRIRQVLDENPIISEEIRRLLVWAADYYQNAIGEVFGIALPTALRQGHKTTLQQETIAWQVTEAGGQIKTDELRRAPKQQELLVYIAGCGGPIDEQHLNQKFAHWREPMRRLLEKGWVNRTEIIAPLAVKAEAPESNVTVDAHLNAEQQQAVDAVLESQQIFQPFLLEGVTGSGKTEVYLKLIESLATRGKHTLVLVPEINLTPQMIGRFKSRLNLVIEVLHSALTDKQRLDAWLQAQQGEIDVVIGTRSAITTPFPNLGLIIVDEEHDSSFKQQEGFRYSARDMAVMRAQILKIPVVLGSATPSFESLHNVNLGRYQRLTLEQRYGNAKPPRMQLVDLRSQPLFDGLSRQLLDAMKQHLGRGNQVLLFINRRGFAPTLLCHDCGWIARCQRCDSHMTYHHAKNKLRCHHCGAERRAEQRCPDCSGASLIPVGEGTERVEQALQKQLPGFDVIRIDRDTTRRKGSLESLLQEVHQGDAKILLGTQMLAKGHHFPDVTLVGILNVDQGLFSVDFRALERTAQLIVQVAGRAGRAEKPGEVMLQTHYPDHPLLQTLLQFGYAQFAQQALLEREQAGLPPFSYMALLRAEAVIASQPLEFLQEAKMLAQELIVQGIELLGPLPSPMEKRAGRYRAQLFIQSGNRAALHKLLHPWVLALEQSKLGRKVRWSIDVDPLDVY